MPRAHPLATIPLTLGLAGALAPSVSAASTAVGQTPLALTAAHAHLEDDRVALELELSAPASRGPHAAELAVALPPTAVVAGGTVAIDGEVRALTLAPAATLEARYDALRTAANPGAAARGGIVLVEHDGWSLQHGVTVRALLPDGGPVKVRLTVDASTCFWRDARYLDVPASIAAALRGVTIVPARRATASGLRAACGEPLDPDDVVDDASVFVRFADGALASHAERDGRIGSRGTALMVGPATAGAAPRTLAGVELAIAGQLGDVPADLHTVLLLDGSRSLTPAQRDAQGAAVAAYLAATPKRRAQVIAFARTAEVRSRGWAASRTVARQLPRLLGGPARNGSDVHAALAAAAGLLADVRGTRRVVLFTDELTASTVPASVAAWRATLPAGTLLHVVALDAHGGSVLTHDDAVRFGELAAGSGGIGVRLQPTDASTDGALDATMLARPIVVEQLRLVSGGWTPLSDPDACLPSSVAGTTMAEGTSCRWVGIAPRSAPRTLEVAGRIWNTPWTRSIALDGPNPAGLARDLTLGRIASLDAPLRAELQAAAAAVNEAYSLGASWGGPEGYPAVDRGLAGQAATCGCDGAPAGFGTGHAGTGTVVGATLEQQLADAFAACKVTGATVDVQLETNRDELVAVGVTVARRADQAPTAADQACVEAALWAATPDVPDDKPLATWHFTYRR